LVILLLFHFSGATLNLGKFLDIISYPLLLVLLFGIGSWRRVAYVATRELGILLLISLGIFSMIWSDSPIMAADAFKSVVRAYAIGVYLASRYSTKELLRLTACMCGIAVLLSFFLPLAMPETFSKGTLIPWQGVYGQKNYLAPVMILSLITLLPIAYDSSSKPKWKHLSLVLTVLSFLLILFSESKTSLVVMVLVLCAIFPANYISKSGYRKRTLFVTLFLAASGFLMFLFMDNFEFIVVDFLGRDLTLNGRTDLWQLAIKIGLDERPLLGYGPNGFWGSPDNWRFIRYFTWASGFSDDGSFHAHSGYVDLFLQYGLIGLFLCFFTLISSLIRIINLMIIKPSLESLWMLQFVLMIIFAQVTGFTMLMAPRTYWILYVAIALSSVLQKEMFSYSRRSKNTQNFVDSAAI
jgi:O-antigen ligase